MNTLAENLKQNHLKVTPQRLSIYSYLTNTNAHPSVETIYNDLKEEHPSLSLATVYKTVASLRDAHLVTEFNVGEDSHRYDANTSFHPHLICTRCHCVVDYLNPTALESSALSNLRTQIAEKKGFRAEAQEFDIYGICPDCQAEENN